MLSKNSMRSPKRSTIALCQYSDMSSLLIVSPHILAERSFSFFRSWLSRTLYGHIIISGLHSKQRASSFLGCLHHGEAHQHQGGLGSVLPSSVPVLVTLHIGRLASCRVFQGHYHTITHSQLRKCDWKLAMLPNLSNLLEDQY
jgi:hypothetical protein